jgi:alkyl hydroperoxide reductase subunit D
MLQPLIEGRESAIARDLKLNLERYLTESSLPHEDALLAALAAAVSVRHEELASILSRELEAGGLPASHVLEARESAAIMAMLNTYYRFRHMIHNDDDYRTAGLRMTALARPTLGRERFERLAFTVSVLNGCESCIRSHEKALRDSGASADQVHDLARIAAVVKGLEALRAA